MAFFLIASHLYRFEVYFSHNLVGFIDERNVVPSNANSVITLFEELPTLLGQSRNASVVQDKPVCIFFIGILVVEVIKRVVHDLELSDRAGVLPFPRDPLVRTSELLPCLVPSGRY